MSTAAERIDEPQPAAKWSERLSAITPTPRLLFVLLLLGSFLLRVVWLSRTGNGLIFDESYYVQAARIIDHIQVPDGAHYSGFPFGIDPNHEHPPLAKVLIAWSISLFGDNGVAWRLPSVATGMIAIVAVYFIVRRLTRDNWAPILAATLFSVDNMVFVHSRIATLDMPMLAFALVAAWLWISDMPLLAGVAAAIAVLMKEGAVYAVLSLFLFEGGVILWERFRGNGRWVLRPSITRGVLMMVTFVPLAILGLWLLDTFYGFYHNPFDHIGYMLHYGVNLVHKNGPANNESDPWQWLINDIQINYFRVDVNVLVNGEVTESRPIVWFRGAMNPVFLGAFPLALGYTLWSAWRFADRAALFAIAWFAGNYLPYYPLSMAEHRISYIFYFLFSMPAVAIAVALLLRDERIPRFAVFAFLVAVAIAFYGYFPFRTLS